MSPAVYVLQKFDKKERVEVRTGPPLPTTRHSLASQILKEGCAHSFRVQHFDLICFVSMFHFSVFLVVCVHFGCDVDDGVFAHLNATSWDGLFTDGLRTIGKMGAKVDGRSCGVSFVWHDVPPRFVALLLSRLQVEFVVQRGLEAIRMIMADDIDRTVSVWNAPKKPAAESKSSQSKSLSQSPAR